MRRLFWPSFATARLIWSLLGLVVLVQPASAQVVTRRDKLAVVLFTVDGNTVKDKYGNQVPVTFLGDQVAASTAYFNRVKAHWEEDSFGQWLMEVLPVYGPYLLPRPAGSPDGCLWDPRTPAIGAALTAAMAGHVPTDTTITWLFPPCPGDQIVFWQSSSTYVQNQGGKISTIYGLWKIELSHGWPWFSVLHCIDATGQPVPLSASCSIVRPNTGIGGDPVATGTFFHTPNQIKRRLGFLTDAQRTLVTGSGTHTVTLTPMETLVSGPTMYAEIHAGSFSQPFFVEWRQKIGMDRGLPTGLDLGVLVRRGDSLVDMTPLGIKDNPALLVGQTLTLAPSAATITLQGIVPGVSATVQVVIP